jgi:hypothetical protein
VEASVGYIVSEERNVADAKLGAIFDGCTVRAPEFAVNKRQIELSPKAIGEVVTDEELRDGTINALIDCVGDFVAVVLQSAEMSELFGKAAKKSATVSAPGLGRSVNGTEVACERRLGTGSYQNCRK